MAEMVLAIGNRNYSSWSLRAWLAVEQSGLSFREEVVYFDEDADRTKRRAFGPTGKVPVLRHGDVVVWDSLAIVEYVAEIAPQAGLWPANPAARATARAICAEMHSGFPTLRSRLAMNVRGRAGYREPAPELAAEIERVVSIWTDARRRFGNEGPFLFGRRSIADAFYAPVAFRFRTYSIPLEGEAAAWVATMLDLPAMRAWEAKAGSEGHPEAPYDALLRAE